MTKTVAYDDKQFISRINTIEKAASRVSAWIAVPTNSAIGDGYGYGTAARIRISYPRDGMGRATLVAWLPNDPAAEETLRYSAIMSGCGYNKMEACMAGAEFWSRTEHRMVAFQDGAGWENTMRKHGYTVFQAI